MQYILGTNSRQTSLGLWSLEEEIAPNSPARFVEVFAESLDIGGMGFTRSTPAPTGRPPYDPRDLVKLYIYGYLNGIRSSRRLMRECERNIEVFFLLNRLRPDFRTIADFRRRHREQLRRVFLLFSRACLDMKLMDADTLCLDGTTIRAVNGKKKAVSAELARKKLEYARAQLEAVERYMDTLDENDLYEKDLAKPMALDLDKRHLPSVQELRERIAFHEDCLRRLAETGAGAILFTDPDAAMMPAKEGGVKACYNVQTAVDPASHLIADFTVTDHANDRGLLDPCMEQAKSELGLDRVRVIADKGYESSRDIEACLFHGTVPDVGFIYDRNERAFSLEYHGGDIAEDERLSSDPRDISRCLHAGVLPASLENSNVRIELQSLSSVSCFLRHEDGSVTCPMGRQLFKLKDTKYGIRYASREACRTCPNRCTDSSSPKEVNIGRNSTYVPVLMYGSPRFPLQQIPTNGVSSSHLHTFGRRHKDEKRVMIFIRRDIPKQKLRQQTSEHPFGTIKHAHGASHFLCRGKPTVTAEFALSALAYNIRRAINICGGVQELILRFKALCREKSAKIYKHSMNSI